MAHTRRDFLTRTAALGVGGMIGMTRFERLFAGSAAEIASIAARKKNVLFIAIDDLRPELGCYGHTIVKSPNIDALARDGVVFERTYCQQAVCGPTRASLLTGKRPDTTKVYDLKTHIRKTMPDVVTLQQHFKNNGYFSEGIGKLFHGGLEDEPSYSVPHRAPKGSRYALESNLDLEKAGGKKTVDTGAAAESTGTTRLRAEATECADVGDDAYGDGRLAQWGVEALNRLAPGAVAKNKDGHQPFFLAVGFSKPHLPFCAPKKYWDLYDRTSPSYAAFPLPPTLKEQADPLSKKSIVTETENSDLVAKLHDQLNAGWRNAK